MKKKTILLFIPSIVAVIALSVGILSHFGIWTSLFSEEACGCQNSTPDHYYLLFSVVVLILASIPITYYYLSKNMEKKLKIHEETLSRIVNKKINRKNKNDLSGKGDILKFLNPSEQKMIKILLKNNGEMLQSQISKIDDMTKLKVHRTAKSLEEKNIIETEHYGKTKKISLTKEIRKLLAS
jgi:uncharacterized membrane protein